MKKTVPCLPVISWLVGVALIFLQPAGAAPVVFTLNQALSQVTASGNVVAENGLFSGPITAQNAGSLTASYAGNINAAISNSTIQFTGSSLIAAETNATPQQPGLGGASGSAPADYGATAQGRVIIEPVTVLAAVRGLVLDLGSPALTVTDGKFPSADLEFSFSTNAASHIDYLDSIGTSGSNFLTGVSFDSNATSASLTNSGGTPILTIPINMTFTQTNGTLAGTTLTLVGQLVGEVLPPPMINSISVTNHAAVLSVTNATTQSQVQVSTNLTSWSATSATTANRSGMIIFTTPVSGTREFFRVQQ